MRRFKVFIESGYARVPDWNEEIVELPDDATDEQIEKACQETLEVLLCNRGTGWFEIEEGE